MNKHRTVVDALKWNPVMNTADWQMVPMSVKDQMTALAAPDPASYELSALLESLTGSDRVHVAWANTDDSTSMVIGFTVVNVWSAAMGPEGVILTFLHPQFNNVRTHTALITSVTPVLNSCESDTVFAISKRDKLLLDALEDMGYNGVHQLLP